MSWHPEAWAIILNQVNQRYGSGTGQKRSDIASFIVMDWNRKDKVHQTEIELLKKELADCKNHEEVIEKFEQLKNSKPVGEIKISDEEDQETQNIAARFSKGIKKAEKESGSPIHQQARIDMRKKRLETAGETIERLKRDEKL